MTHLPGERDKQGAAAGDPGQAVPGAGDPLPLRAGEGRRCLRPSSRPAETDIYRAVPAVLLPAPSELGVRHPRIFQSLQTWCQDGR